MSEKQVEILFICGSPRSHTSEALLALIEQGVRDAGARSRRFLLSEKHIAPCIGCGSCEITGNCILANEDSKLFADDDYVELVDALSSADALAVVAPLFFAGPSAQLKALYDRMQPYYARTYILGQKPDAKRPAQIFILGGGGDSHGYDPLVTISRSSLAVAGFTLEKVQNFIGYKYYRDVAALPTEEEASQMAFGELAHARKAAAAQREFEQRALAAGRAFARFVDKSQEKNMLQAELSAVEAEMAQLQEEVPDHETISPAYDYEGPQNDYESVRIVNRVDSDFEALKQNARASRASKVNQVKLDEVIEEAVAVMSEHGASETEPAAETLVDGVLVKNDPDTTTPEAPPSK